MAVKSLVSQLKFISRLDLGYGLDEKAHKYEQTLRLPGVKIDPVETLARQRNTKEGPFLEIGHAVLGRETFTVKTSPGKTLTVVLRTGRSARLTIYTCRGNRRVQNLLLDLPTKLDINVGKNMFKYEINSCKDENQFVEAAFEIPGSAITGDMTQITISGDHISYAYWFYEQKK